MNREQAVTMAGLRTYDVYNVLQAPGICRAGQEGTPLWSGLASSEIHAMDIYVRSVDETYTGYTALIADDANYDELDELEGMYEYRDRLCGILESSEICAIERKADFPQVSQDSIDGAIEKATDAFWREVHRVFPCDTGDMDPLTVHAFDVAQRSAVQAWLNANAPRTYVAVVFDTTGLTEDQVGHLAAEAGVQGEQNEYHPDATSATVQATFTGSLDDLIDDLPESWRRD